MGRRGYRSPFLLALRKIPIAQSNEMIFHYLFSTKDYDTSTFDALKFKNAIQRAEMDQVISELKNVVSMYEVYPEGDRIAPYLIYGGLALGVLLAMAGAALGLGNACFVPIPVCFIIGCFLTQGLRIMYKKKLLRREKEIKGYLDQANLTWSGRGVRWTTGQYGTYLMLTQTSGGAYGSGMGLLMYNNKPRLAASPDSGLVSAGPETSQRVGYGYGGGFNQPPPRIPMQPIGMRNRFQPGPYTPVGSHQVAPIALYQSTRKPYEPGEELDNSHVVMI